MSQAAGERGRQMWAGVRLRPYARPHRRRCHTVTSPSKLATQIIMPNLDSDEPLHLPGCVFYPLMGPIMISIPPLDPRAIFRLNRGKTVRKSLIFVPMLDADDAQALVDRRTCTCTSKLYGEMTGTRAGAWATHAPDGPSTGDPSPRATPRTRHAHIRQREEESCC